MAEDNRRYVFVCCGAREHVDTLHVALEALRKRTACDIIVVTDSARNEIPVVHHRVEDVATPAYLTHHQASIWLKTSLHRILPKGNRYVYLDTDILAIGTHPDGVFDEYIPPIRFAADHCRLMQFSPYAVNCRCLDENERLRSKINGLISEADPYFHTADETVRSERRQLQNVFGALNTSRLRKLGTAVRFVLTPRTFRLSRFYFDKRQKVWFNEHRVPVMYQVDMKKIAKAEGLRWNVLKNEIQKPDGRSIWHDHCDHLPRLIEKKFGVRVSDADWQHWNGGVFLFSDESHEFMETWHRYTVSVFSDAEWKTRDQGTLVATAWKWGLQRQPVLDPTWNYIADYHNPRLRLSADGQTISTDGRRFIRPELVHVYHHFGDTGWEIWNWVERMSK